MKIIIVFCDKIIRFVYLGIFYYFVAILMLEKFEKTI